MSAREPSAVFVYGTLQRGEERAGCWPHAPLAITPAVISAELYDLGLYPAIIPGNDRVAGELWELHPEQLAETLRVLDAIEGYYGQEVPNLYVRRVVASITEDGRTVPAFTYFYADTVAAGKYLRVRKNADGLCRWSGSRLG
jgi:gamma-glutamylcyclotransferase (GGCT)/AIG2-like uncharacterized protein YtfP